jgi:hypothetical protein
LKQFLVLLSLEAAVAAEQVLLSEDEGFRASIIGGFILTRK